MSDEDLISAMRRKAGVGRPPPDVTVMSAAKALRLAVVKAAEEATGMVMQVTDVREELTSTSRLPDVIPDHSLLALLEGPENTYGLAVFSLAVTTSVVEQMTTGNVQKHPPEDRKPTSTDSVMCFELIDSMLAFFEQIVAEAVDPPVVEGYRAAAQLSETRSIPIAFDDIRYRMYRLSVDMGRGLRNGEIMFIYPASRPKPKPEPGMPSDVANLEVGMTIPIPHEALSRVEVVADGHRVSQGRLGQVNGYRAVRVDLHPTALTDDDGGMDGGAGFPALGSGALSDEMEMDLPGLGDFPAMGSMGDEGDAMSGELPPLGDLGSDFPTMGDMGDDLPALGDMGDFPAMGELPSLD
jgi:flagellar motor switch protein FliM